MNEKDQNVLENMKQYGSMTYIHILRGTGNNCTCYDCAVLYGGKCDTTPDNNFLDKLEKQVLQYLNYTPTGKPRKKSDLYSDSVINEIMRPALRKYWKVQNNQFDRKYYTLMPLVYLMTSDRKEASGWYRRSRNWLFNSIHKEFEEK